MLACKIFTAPPVILYPVELKVELWIENKDVTSIFDNFLQSGACAFEILLSR